MGDVREEPLSERVSVLLADQRARWRQGDAALVESYLEDNPELRGHPDTAVELIRSEISLRVERGETPPFQEYSERFPEYADRLREHFSERPAGASGAPPADVTKTAIESASEEPVRGGPPKPPSRALPRRLGRYDVLSTLGTGGFGDVYLGYDGELERQVAIKVPHARHLGTRRRIDAFLAEARNMARLSHPGIVGVHDVGREGDACYIVSQFIDGKSLADRIRQGRFHPVEVARIASRVAEALDHAHSEGLVHRDIKPANILLDAEGQPFVADFGLAFAYKEPAVGRGEVCGTPPYMAPEQVRGEDHLIGARTDVYSLGIVIYELLAGRLPFTALDVARLFAAILSEEPRPLREIDASIPAELERICLKACSKAIGDRYPSAGALAEELRAFVDSASAGAIVQSPRGDAVVPKGLRPFGPEDADFFLELLPGPRDREGLPDALRFWKMRIESVDESSAFRVGLLFGPSGCGKSSLVKAGLLPRLDASVATVYVEATPDDTEARLETAVRRVVPDAPPGTSLAECFSSIRRAEGEERRKVVVILDQFEQWLHAHAEDLWASDLVAALRQADGARVQCLLMIRDDFWVAATRLFRALEIRMLEDHNVRLVDLFDADHGRKVLELFGRAYGRLPAERGETTDEQRAFLQKAVAGLARDGRIVSVRLSLFAEMLKDREWTPATLRAAGGMEGVGAAFLEKTLGARSAVPEHRTFEKPARAVLEALLPDTITDIKGVRRSTRELQEASGLSEHPDRFGRLLEILDRELHIISPVEVEDDGGAHPDGASRDADDAERYYQLTHDYLVPALREWLTRKRRETWRGRAELKLRKRTNEWIRTREKRFLPAFSELVAISLAVREPARTEEQRTMLRSARRHHGVRWGAGLAVVVLVAAAFLLHRSAARREQAEARVDAVVTAVPAAVPYAIRNLENLEGEAASILHRRLEGELTDPGERLNAACALAAFEDVRLDRLLEGLRSVPASVDACRNIVAALGTTPEPARELLARELTETHAPDLRARLAITLLELGDPDSATRLLKLEPDPAQRTAFIHSLAGWRGDLDWLGQLLRASDDAAFRSGVCIALGRIEPGELRKETRRELGEVLAELYAGAPSGATHSAAGWALTRWKLPTPTVETSKSAFRGQRWFVNGQGMTMLRIEPGSFRMGNLNDARSSEDPRTPHRVTITRPYSIGDREIPVGLFAKFVAEAGSSGEVRAALQAGCATADPVVSPSSLHPMQSVTWEQAVLFCNWLSGKEGRAPCYRRANGRGPKESTSSDGGDSTWSAWTCDFDANGYRLPTEAEWEYAARAGTATTFYFGNDRSLLSEYGITSNDRKIEALPGGTLIPNAWGLFDVHGNVWEWCWDWNRTFPAADEVDPRGPPLPTAEGGARRVHRGGGIANSRGDPDSKARGHAFPTQCFWNVGFRVVCAAE